MCMALQPRTCMRNHIFATALDRVITIFTHGPAMKASVVGGETSIKSRRTAGLGIENRASYKGSGCVALQPQYCRGIRDRLRQRNSGIVDPMELRIGARKDRRV